MNILNGSVEVGTNHFVCISQWQKLGINKHQLSIRRYKFAVYAARHLYPMLLSMDKPTHYKNLNA